MASPKSQASFHSAYTLWNSSKPMIVSGPITGTQLPHSQNTQNMILSITKISFMLVNGGGVYPMLNFPGIGISVSLLYTP